MVAYRVDHWSASWSPQAMTFAQSNIAMHFENVCQAVAHTRRFHLLDGLVVFVGLHDARCQYDQQFRAYFALTIEAEQSSR